MVSTALDVVSTSTRGISAVDRPLLTASHLVNRPGAHPRVMFPMVGTALPDVDGLWAHLAEPAEFFGVPIPPPTVLSDCLTAFASALHPAPALTAVTVTLVDGAAESAVEFLVTGAAVPSVGPPVRVDRCDIAFPLTRRDDDHWLRMAARTTSRADRDQLRRWLAGRGFADAVSADSPAPFLGALVHTRRAAAYGVDNPQPESILTSLLRCGAIGDVRVVTVPPDDAEHVWWISPEYRIHPVSAIGPVRYRTGAAARFARLP